MMSKLHIKGAESRPQSLKSLSNIAIRLTALESLMAAIELRIDGLEELLKSLPDYCGKPQSEERYVK